MSFDRAFELVIGSEGGYVNDKHDPGGETKYGISKRAYPYIDIKTLTLVDAKRIYKRDYWDRVDGDGLPWPLSFFLFDSAVNQGVHTAVVLMQKSLNLKQDGILGPETLSAIWNSTFDELGPTYMADRAMRYAETFQFKTYGRGWLRRLFKAMLEVNE